MREERAVAGIFDDAVFAPVNTFMGAPQSWDLADAKAAVLGIPFDAGTHAVRIGARASQRDALTQLFAKTVAFEMSLGRLASQQIQGLKRVPATPLQSPSPRRNFALGSSSYFQA
jgi:arginase family enzyme